MRIPPLADVLPPYADFPSITAAELAQLAAQLSPSSDQSVDLEQALLQALTLRVAAERLLDHQRGIYGREKEIWQIRFASEKNAVSRDNPEGRFPIIFVTAMNKLGLKNIRQRTLFAARMLRLRHVEPGKITYDQTPEPTPAEIDAWTAEHEKSGVDRGTFAYWSEIAPKHIADNKRNRSVKGAHATKKKKIVTKRAKRS